MHEKLAFLKYPKSQFANLDGRIAHFRRSISYELISKRIAAVKKGRARIYRRSFNPPLISLRSEIPRNGRLLRAPDSIRNAVQRCIAFVLDARRRRRRGKQREAKLFIVHHHAQSLFRKNADLVRRFSVTPFAFLRESPYVLLPLSFFYLHVFDVYTYIYVSYT